MAQAITAVYVQEDDDWTVTVAGWGKELDDRAPGIIAARDRADQLVEKIAPEGASPTVVHLLNGSALEFTSVYMTARLARSEPESEELENKTEAAGKVATTPEQPKPRSRRAAANKNDGEAAAKPTRRGVPRKELSKSPKTAAKKETPSRQNKSNTPRAENNYASSAAGSRPRAAGQASAAG
ncbi:hypothetical protein ABZ863_05450 [Saccharomonospora sp. NPDC046836]|uniref:hypothetical protein n=1 Tax=Saccharomonospora sp. NPDC046836 TaxID=3156921 RepID=UPI0033DD14F3